MFQDPTFWVAVAFAVLVGSFWYWGRPQLGIILEKLDNQSRKIKFHMEDAQHIYDKTHALYEQSKASVEDAKKQALEILNHTKVEIQHYQKDAEENLRHMESVLEDKISNRLHRGRNQAMKDLQKEVATLVLEASQDVIQHILKDPKNNALLLDASLDEIQKQKKA